jgi:hypothetical protein
MTIFGTLIGCLRPREGRSATLHSIGRLGGFTRNGGAASAVSKPGLIVLHEINAAITRLRERNGLTPIDDGRAAERFYPGQGSSVSAKAGSAAGRVNPVREQWRQ